jgi:hypothetical protein
MKTTVKILSIVTGIFFFNSCKNTEIEESLVQPVKSTISNNLNISILIDLSDRISPNKYPNKTMEYYLRDVGYINSASEAFTEHLNTKKVRQAKDKIQLFFDPEPFNPDINSISDKLKFNINKENISNETIFNIKQKYANEPLKIYNLAINDNHFVGSDTWRFFKNKINDQCIEDNYRNILIVLTDGYIYFNNSRIKESNLTSYLTPEMIKASNLNKQNWAEIMVNQKYGFIPANTDLSNLEILVLGINPDPKNPYEEDVIKAYWTKWFEDMKVKRYEIRSAELPSNMDNIIKNFIKKI